MTAAFGTCSEFPGAATLHIELMSGTLFMEVLMSTVYTLVLYMAGSRTSW